MENDIEIVDSPAWLSRLGALGGVVGSLLMLAGGIWPQSMAKFILLGASPLPFLPWLVAVHRAQRAKTGWLGSASFWLALVAIPAFAAFLLVLVPGGPEKAPPIPPLAWEMLARAARPMFIVGFTFFGLVTMMAGVFPPAASGFLAAGLAQTGYLVGPGPVFVVAGAIWIAAPLWNGRRVRAPVPDLGARSRLPALDALRGLIMVIMALDHMRLAVQAHPAELWYAAMEPVRSAPVFLTRLVTHVCAPGFFFLMGTGAVLFAESRKKAGWGLPKIAGHLALRGLALYAVEQLLVYPFQNGSPTLYLYTVLFCLGGSLVLCAPLVGLGRLPLLGLSIPVILMSQLWPSLFGRLGLLDSPVVRILFVPGPAGPFFSLYPVASWAGIALLGMAFGRHLLRSGERAWRHALFTGIACLPLFVLVRALGGSGNFQPAAGPGALDFLNMVKYPPSLGFLLLFLGLDLVLLYLFSRASEWLERRGRPLLVFGSVALFFYVVHFILYFAIRFLFFRGGIVTNNAPLWSVYAGWAAGLVLLYPLCRRFGEFKRTTAPGSPWRLL